MKVKEIISSFFFFVLFVSKCQAQDPSYTQAFTNPVFLNPAFTGINEGIRVSSIARDQWDRIPGVFLTPSLSIESFEPKMNSGIGLTLSKDVEGEGFLTNDKIGVSYQWTARQVKLFKAHFNISGGLSYSYANVYIDWSKLQFYDQFDTLGKIYQSSSAVKPTMSHGYSDWGLGFAIKSRRYNKHIRDYDAFIGGLSFQHLTQPKYSLYDVDQKLPLLTSLQLAFYLPFSGNSVVHDGYVFPHLVIQNQGTYWRGLVGLYGIREPLVLGLSYHTGQNPFNIKNTNAICFTAGYQQPFKNSTIAWQLLYTYDLNFTGLSLSTFGSHELGIVFFFDDKSILGSGKDDHDQSPCLKVRKKGHLPPF